MSAHQPAETIRTRGCLAVLRRIEGPEAIEVFLQCQPPCETSDAGRQAEAIYRALLEILEAQGGVPGSIVSETLYLRSLPVDLEPVRAARQRVLATSEGPPPRPATAELGQPPLNERARLEVSLQALVPRRPPLRVDLFEAAPACRCVDCGRSHGRRIQVGEESRLHAGGLYGRGEDAFEQTLGMFGVAEGLLRQAGMEFRDVVRTWIHLRDIERDYADLNRARRAFFEARGIDPVPASTGIGCELAAKDHDLSLGIYAVRAPRPLVRTLMTAPTLSEAMLYGADFARGTKMVETNKIALHVSGTASIDEAGRTAHPRNLASQVDRMLVNVAALLEGQGASFGDIVSAVTYLKRPADAVRLRERLRDAGFEGFPHVLVSAPICRPDLLCETEALAVLPRAASSASGAAPTRPFEKRVRAPGGHRARRPD